MRKPLALVAALLVPLAFAPPAEAFVYWTTATPDAIGRAKLDGTDEDRSLIRTNPYALGVAVGPGRG